MNIYPSPIAFVTGILVSLALLPAAWSAGIGSGMAGSSSGIIEGRVQSAITGSYLNNARVTVKGTNLRVFSDQTGLYRLTNVPSGTVVMEVFYTSLDPTQVTLTVPPGQTVTRDVSLTNAALYGALTKDEALQLDPFTVESTRLTDQAAIAINEQRFAPNIMSVVATGDISEQPDGSLGELVKSMPGIAGSAGGAGANAIYVRGFPPHTTQITVDGMSFANTGFGNPSRTVSINQEAQGSSITRLEVTKVPTPSTGADTMAGSVNLVTRTAFEADRAKLSYEVHLAGVLSDMTDGKTPTGFETTEFPTRPGFTFRYTNPVSENFGFTLSGSYSDKQRPEEQIRPFLHYTSPTFGASLSDPLFYQYQYRTGTSIDERRNVQMRLDWRATPNSVLSGTLETFHWRDLGVLLHLQQGAGNNANSRIAGGVQGSYGRDYTIGGTGRGNLSYTNQMNYHSKAGYRTNLRYRFDNGDWKVDLKAGYSRGRMWRRDGKYGFFRNVTTSTPFQVRAELYDIHPITGPAEILMFDNNNELLDVYDPGIHENRVVTGANLGPRWQSDLVQDYQVDIRRRIGFLPFPAAVQVGARSKVRDKDYSDKSTAWSYNGPGGDQSPMPYVSSMTWTRGAPAGKSVPIISPVLAYRAWQDDSSLFYQTPAQLATAERVRRQNSEQIKEAAEAAYIQLEGRFMDNRLNVLTGVRYEKTTGEGEGLLQTPDAVWLRNADGTFALDNGQRIRRADAGAPGSIEDIRLVYHQRGARSERSYDGYYPSVHLTYDITPKFLARAAFAKTYGRPAFNFIIPRTTVNDFSNPEADEGEEDISGGRLTVRNAGLLPWTASNYDLSLEYYTDQGGVFSAGLFRKEVKNFFGNVIRSATALDLVEAGLDPAAIDLDGWEVSTTVNTAAADVNGFELAMNHSLLPLDPWLGGWGRNFNVYANVTKLRITGPGAANLSGFLPLGINGGIRFNKKPFMLSASANHRGEETTSIPTNRGTNGRNYYPALTRYDFSLGINLRSNLTFFFNVRDAFNKPRGIYQESDELPDYAIAPRNTVLGAHFFAGIKGSF